MDHHLNQFQDNVGSAADCRPHPVVTANVDTAQVFVVQAPSLLSFNRFENIDFKTVRELCSLLLIHTFWGRLAGLEYYVEHCRGRLLIVTNDEAAQDYKIVQTAVLPSVCAPTDIFAVMNLRVRVRELLKVPPHWHAGPAQ